MAEGLPAPLLDIDSILVRQMGMPITQIFGMVGEPRFRDMERDAVDAAQAREPAVIVPGAGWAAQPGQLDAGQAAVASSSISSARHDRRQADASRARRGRCWSARIPLERMRALLEEREPFYRLADYEVAADVKAAAAVAEEVVGLARAHGGW